MAGREHVWAIVAAGEPALRPSLSLARSLVPAGRIVPVLVEQWPSCRELDLGEIAEDNVLVQPAHRGSAVALLLGLLHVHLRQGDAARVVFLGAERAAEDKQTLRASLVEALEAAHEELERLVLLGLTPEGVEGWKDWVVAWPSASGPTRQAACFMMTPDRATAAHLVARGAGLLNCLVGVAASSTLLRMYAGALPELLGAFRARLLARGAWTPERLRGLYVSLPRLDLVHDVFEPAIDLVSVLPVPPRGWGSPQATRDFARRPAPGGFPSRARVLQG